jgi:hypothetical protein
MIPGSEALTAKSVTPDGRWNNFRCARASEAQNQKRMRLKTRGLICWWSALLPLTALADPESVVRDAINMLGGTTFAWETTVRQRFTGETSEPRLNASAPLESEGKFDPQGYSEITLSPSAKGVPVPVTAVFFRGDVVGSTPMGWKLRSEMRSVPGPDRTVDFEGKQVRMSRALAVALKVTAQRNLTEELFDLVMDLKSYREESGLILAELREGVIEKLWGDPQAKRAPEVQGTVIFKLSGGNLTEFHTLLAIGFPNSRTKKTAWTMQQWSTRIRGIGSTKVEPPREAVKRLSE